jgi:hypothetical protein
VRTRGQLPLLPRKPSVCLQVQVRSRGVRQGPGRPPRFLEGPRAPFERQAGRTSQAKKPCASGLFRSGRPDLNRRPPAPKADGASGLATVWDRFCLSASTVDDRRWTLATVARELGPRRRRWWSNSRQLERASGSKAGPKMILLETSPGLGLGRSGHASTGRGHDTTATPPLRIRRGSSRFTPRMQSRSRSRETGHRAGLDPPRPIWCSFPRW